MKRIFSLFFMLCLLILPAQAMAQTVQVTGEGLTASAAERDALRNAVEKSVGTLVNGETLVNNAQVIRDEIYSVSQGFVSKYQVVSQQRIGDAWKVTIVAEVSTGEDSPLYQKLANLQIIDRALRNPKIAVYIPEEHLRYRVPDPAGETAVIKALLEAGFDNVIAASPKMRDSSFSWQNKTLNDINVEDMRSAARFLSADILIMGESFSEGVGDIAQFLPGNQTSGMKSCRARVEAKMYKAQTGQIIAADGKYASGLDISEAIASKKALASAGGEMGSYLAQKLLSTNLTRQGFELVIEGAGFERINRVQNALANIRGVTNVHMASYENGRAVFSMYYGGEPRNLYQELAQASDVDISMISASYNVLTIRVN